MQARFAGKDDVEDIGRICISGHRVTYAEILPTEEIDAVIAEYYTHDRWATGRRITPGRTTVRSSSAVRFSRTPACGL